MSSLFKTRNIFADVDTADEHAAWLSAQFAAHPDHVEGFTLDGLTNGAVVTTETAEGWVVEAVLSTANEADAVNLRDASYAQMESYGAARLGGTASASRPI